MHYKWTKRADEVVYPTLIWKSFYFCFSIITRRTWRYTVDSIPPYYNNFNRPGNKTGVNATFDSNKNWNNTRYVSFVRVTSRHFTSSVGSMVTGIMVKSAHDHSVLCGFAFLSIYRNLSVTVVVRSLGANLSTSLLVSGVSWPSPGFHRNQFLLEQCYLCRQQQPPCGETATPSRTQSIYHKPASRRLWGRWQLLSSIAKPEGLLAFASSAFRLATWKDSKNDKQNKMKGTMTCCLLTQV